MVINMELYKNKYRIESIRLKNWDYSNSGYYFVTICTKNQEHFFGEINNNEMILSDIGKIIYDEWYKSAEIRPNILLDEFIIMPNHIHGIIIINNNEKNIFVNNDVNVETHSYASLQPTINENKQNNLSNIIRGFKSSSTKLIHISGCNNFLWQPRFYEHIIKDETALKNIRQYIINNPSNWKNNIEYKIKKVQINFNH